MDLKGKAAIVTGGARIGQSIAEALAEKGCAVAVTYRKSRAEAESVVQRARALGVKALAIPADLRTEKGAAQTVGRAAKAFGRLDALVNLASVYRKTPLASLDERRWRESLDTDLGSAYRLALRAAPWMRKAGGGRIVNFADWLAASGRPRYQGFLPYYTAKSAVKGLTEALALELAPEILVNAVAPGPILPPSGLTEKERRAVALKTPLRKWGGPGEIVKAVLFFMESDFVTGECLRVDGGRHLL